MIDYTTISNVPFWWLDTAFGKQVFILMSITWGLIIIALIQVNLLLMRILLRKKK